MRTHLWLVAGLLGLAGVGCATQSKAPERAAEGTLPAVDESALDRTAEPCEDFYRFACGGWVDDTPIPPDRPAWFRSFSEIEKRNETVLREVMEQAAAGELDDPDAERLGAFWTACMDEEAAEANLPLLQEILAEIDASDGDEPLARAVAQLQLAGADAFFRFGSTQDYRDASEVIGIADQGGLSLPDRDYYLREGERAEALREDFVRHVATLLALAGEDEARARANAERVMEIETALAAASLSRVKRRNPYVVYNRLDRQGLVEQAPSFPWDTYFDELDIPDVEPINVTSPAFFSSFDELWRELTPEDKKTYLRWHAVRMAAPALGAAFVEEAFRFRSTHLTGEEELAPRWKRCLQASSAAIGQAMSRVFVARTFSPEAKQEAEELIRGIEEAFGENLDTLSWMDDATREQAHEKLSKLRNQIAYPAEWRSYEGLDFTTDSYLTNQISAAAFESERQLAKIGKPVDRNEWWMHPHQVNAYFSHTRNEMVFPAGILQPPFFAGNAPLSANAGAIGMVMGHELTHGFDDRGRRFDAYGNLRDWWSEASGKAYEERAACVEEQYSAYEVVDGLYIDGKLTLGENIADIGGLEMAWRAFEKRQPDLHRPGAQGFSPAQEFFLAYGQIWCGNRRDAYARMLLSTDTHSPPRFRVNGAVSNLPAFREAFQCEVGQPMAPERICQVW